jgi:23S rRNA G2445 N2-methylase RlmL
MVAGGIKNRSTAFYTVCSQSVAVFNSKKPGFDLSNPPYGYRILTRLREKIEALPGSQVVLNKPVTVHPLKK